MRGTSRSTGLRVALAGLTVAVLALIAGCGAAERPVLGGDQSIESAAVVGSTETTIGTTDTTALSISSAAPPEETSTSSTDSTTSEVTTSSSAPPAADAILVFTRTTGYRHPSIESGAAAVQELAASVGLQAIRSEDPAQFNDSTLAGYAAVVFVSTSGDILNPDQQSAFERFIGNGGGFLGIHAASDTEYEWPWYGGLVGAYFSDHPLVENFVDCHCFEADVLRVTGDPSTDHLPQVWGRRDEWYNFRSQPSGVTVLLKVDEATYTGGTMGDPHPISWKHHYAGGRSWYTAMGHTASSFDEPEFRQHLFGGLRWVAGLG